MKKIGFAVLSAALAGCAAVAKDNDLYSTETHTSTPLQVGIADPLQLPSSSCNVYGLRWNLFYDASFGVYGLDLGLVGLCRDKMAGLAVQAVNWVDGAFCGLQFGGVFNVVNGDSSGAQFGGVLNSDRGSFWGFQSAAVNNVGSLFGVQLGCVNWDRSLSQGLQVGAVNADLNEFDGCSVGLINTADSFTGFQFGCINVIATAGSGFQLGVVNAADVFTGVQIGALNLLGNAVVPVMPFFNCRF